MSMISNKAQAYQRIQEIYSQIATSRSGVNALEHELQELQIRPSSKGNVAKIQQKKFEKSC